ncbi:monooxygenase [Paecilomyces variotii No. 5]|uniref:Monooxygenase n=1 Tax=Byssochlamys spectabilis (strain No. 5 / NBRC 109023) TaxID=1356009 RepID=V5G4Z0_BYSSN|nr:monooxygenase [Paecilomyces variotii No. 5]
MISAEILIVGSGPTGLWLALELRRANIDVLIIDSIASRDARPTHSKALSMSAGSLATFESRGIAQDFIDAGLSLHKAHFGGLETLLDLNCEVLGTRHSHNLAIPQARTEALLLNRCEEAGVRFLWGLRFQSLCQDQERVLVSTAHLTAGGELRLDAKWVIGCDGTHSAVRRAAEIPFEGSPSSIAGMLADIQLNEKPGTITISRGSKGGCMTVPLGDGIYYRFVGLFKDSMMKPLSNEPTLEEVKECMRDAFGSDLGAHSPLWLSRFGNACRLATSFRAGRVFLAGDSAHQFFPAGGQGMNLGIQDATNLAWKLALVLSSKQDGAFVERALDSYTAERRAAAGAVISNVQAQTAVLMGHKAHEVALREVLCEALKNPDLNALWARRVTGFGEPRYPYHPHTDSGKSDPDDQCNPLVGTRMTHVGFETEQELFRAAKLDRFVFLLRNASQCDKAAEIEELHTICQHWADRVTKVSSSTFSTNRQWKDVIAVLIRPDMRIAWVSTRQVPLSRSKETLESVLLHWFGSKEEFVGPNTE